MTVSLFLFALGAGIIVPANTISGAAARSASPGLPRVVISSGGPYLARTSAIERHRDAIVVPPQYVDKPLSLVCTNGSYTAAGFNWVRLFLQPGSADSDAAAGDFGTLLVDENSFSATSQIFIDLTGRLTPGRNNILVEGVGIPGSCFSWELRTIGPPALIRPNPPVTTSGAPLIVYGIGFSLRPEENTAMLGSMAVPVLETTQGAIKVLIPPGLPESELDFSVSIRNYRSNIIKMVVLPGPKITSLSAGTVVAGQTLIIGGTGLSSIPEENAVYIGGYRAQVLSSSTSAVSVEVPRLPAAKALPVFVFVRGARAAGNFSVRALGAS
ncbi:MAG TPA: IPT/TIG domain-containing protein [Candidatus Obscuribacterales bacterium]